MPMMITTGCMVDAMREVLRAGNLTAEERDLLVRATPACPAAGALVCASASGTRARARARRGRGVARRPPRGAVGAWCACARRTRARQRRATRGDGTR